MFSPVEYQPFHSHQSFLPRRGGRLSIVQRESPGDFERTGWVYIDGSRAAIYPIREPMSFYIEPGGPVPTYRAVSREGGPVKNLLEIGAVYCIESPVSHISRAGPPIRSEP